MLTDYQELLTISEIQNNEYSILLNNEFLEARNVKPHESDEILKSMLVLLQDKIGEDRARTPIALKVPIPPMSKKTNFVFTTSLFANDMGDYKVRTTFGSNVQKDLPLKSGLYYILKVLKELRVNISE